MFDIGWQELFIIAVLGLIVVGPKDLPRALRTITQYVRKARVMARDFQNGIDEVVREVELEDIKSEFKDVVEYDIEEEVTSALDPDGDLTGDIKQLESDMRESLDSSEDGSEAEIPPQDEAESALDDAPGKAPDKANG
ncbi:MAG: Sec-independent protein translocase protein TatB [Rhodospirillales bacterium]|nr:Sec-independent protein translocase protein TatB [Rhodospirillales bacterium]